MWKTQERLETRERRDRGDKQSTPKGQNGESGTFSRTKNDTWGNIVLTDIIVQAQFRTQNTSRYTQSIAGQRAPERTLVRICAIFETVMM